ncbi:MAG: NADH-quinone oxidoreductase subunit L [Candidatus Acidiferrales bacterium]
MLMLNNVWIILALPILGAAINGLFGRRFPKAAVNSVAIGSVALTFAAVCELVREFWYLPASQLPWVKTYFTWMAAGEMSDHPFRIHFALQVDQLTVIMLLTVSFVGLMIHIYSIGYMAHEGGYYRFFSYMNLFMFFMLTLVLGANLAVLFVGWEGVGFCSYILIAFWFRKKSAADAGKKAFITTRLGDLAFMVGILLTFWTFGSLTYTNIFEQASKMQPDTAAHAGVLTAIAVLLFVGAIGKSAQLPLYVWLPDAMEGPTPVSALIHAATMVTAGVYMVARMNPVYSRAPIAMYLVAVVGGITALYAATIALTQTDIKKVLAYSTISQLGYMFLGCGVGAYAAGIFHLMTHAFFKGLLFLTAGSVIHAMGGEQDMTKMGGLRKKIPVTYWTMLIATLAIAGIPGFAGFFSKDEILGAVRSGPHASLWLWVVGVVGAGLTSFYMFRLMFLTFFGKPRFDEHQVHVHESPLKMTIPMSILAFLAIFGGWVAAPKLVGGVDYFDRFLQPVFTRYAPSPVVSEASGAPGVSAGVQLLLAIVGIPVILAVIGLLVAWWLYIKRPRTPNVLAQKLRGAYVLLINKYYVDEIYLTLIIRPFLWISRTVLWQLVDTGAIDGVVNGTATVARGSGEEVRELQSGNTRSYAAWIVVGAVGFTMLLLAFIGLAVR